MACLTHYGITNNVIFETLSVVLLFSQWIHVCVEARLYLHMNTHVDIPISKFPQSKFASSYHNILLYKASTVSCRALSPLVDYCVTGISGFQSAHAILVNWE